MQLQHQHQLAQRGTGIGTGSAFLVLLWVWVFLCVSPVRGLELLAPREGEAIPANARYTVSWTVS